MVPFVRRPTDWMMSWYGACNGEERAMETRDREEEERSKVRGGREMLEESVDAARQGTRSTTGAQKEGNSQQG